VVGFFVLFFEGGLGFLGFLVCGGGGFLGCLSAQNTNPGFFQLSFKYSFSSKRREIRKTPPFAGAEGTNSFHVEHFPVPEGYLFY